MIADMISGLSKVLEKFSPQERAKKRLADIHLAKAERDLALSGDTSSLSLSLKKQQLKNAEKTGGLIDARTTRTLHPIFKPSKASETPSHLQQYYNPDLTPIEPDLPAPDLPPVSEPQASAMPLGGVDLPDEDMVEIDGQMVPVGMLQNLIGGMS